MITVNEVLVNLKKLIGQEFDYNDIICAFEDFEEDGVSYVYVGKSHNYGYDYIAYITTEESTQFLIIVKKIYNEETCNFEKEIIEDIWIA